MGEDTADEVYKWEDDKLLRWCIEHKPLFSLEDLSELRYVAKLAGENLEKGRLGEYSNGLN